MQKRVMQVEICILVVIFYSIGAISGDIKLAPAFINVIENSTAKLTCSKTNGNLAESIWVNSQITEDANLLLYNNVCMTTRFLLNSDLFNGLCNQDGSYSVILKRIDRKQHGAEWSCREGISLISKTVTIYVSVPATTAVLSRPNAKYAVENQTQTFTCITSASRPDPRVQWYFRKATGEVLYNLTQFSTFKYVEGEYGLKSTESTLNFRPDKTMNNLRLYCEVWTQSDISDITSNEVILNVAYPPDNLPLIHGFETNTVKRVIELETEESVCSVNGGNPLASLSWNCFGSDDINLETRGSTVRSTLKWTALRSYSNCSCTSVHTLSKWKRTTYVTFDVQYPPDKPRITMGSAFVVGDAYAIENNTFQAVCKSVSNPSPKYTWTGLSNFWKDGDTLRIQNITKRNEGEYKCKASNRMTRTDNSFKEVFNSSSLNLKILYPPSHPKIRFENFNGRIIESYTLNVVINDTVTVYCDVDGNPEPIVRWDDYNSSPTLRISTIRSDIEKTCTATNVMKETASESSTKSKSEASLFINVYYPPSTPIISVSNYRGNSVQIQDNSVSIIESETIDLICFSKSKPMPTYTWVNKQTFKEHTNNILNFVNISRNESGTYTCNVQNTMMRSIGKTEEGINNSTMTLNILYPAILNTINDRSIVEGSALEIFCHVVNGNPSNSTVSWSRLSDKIRWSNKKLFIKNVSRADDTDYICSVITEMHPTIGDSLSIERNTSFHLSVFFPAEIKTFKVSTEISEGTVVINEGVNVSLSCIAEANPLSDITIKNPLGYHILGASKSNIAHHTINKTTYKDAGEYICTGKNNYTVDLPSQSELILIVRSLPRPASGDKSLTKVATVMDVDVTLQFTALNFLDKPNRTIFNWFKNNVSITDFDSKYMIHYNGLETNVTVRNTNQHDLGLYKVIVENSVGKYTHYYDLKATDKPEPPKDFYVVNDSITDTSVQLAWKPGFNGGFQQTFVIMYKMKHTTVWLNTSVTDNKEKNMNYTLFHLSSLKEYEIEMFAKNIEGNSARTERLQFVTKEPYRNQIKSKTKDITAIITGSLSSVVIIVVAVAIVGVIFFYRRRRNKSMDSLYQNVPTFGTKGNCKPKAMNIEKKKRRNCSTDETTFGAEKSIKRKAHLNGDGNTWNISETVEHAFEGLQEIDDVPIIFNEKTEYCNSPERIDRITIPELYAYVFGNDDNLEAEYQKLPTGLQKPCTFARKPENIALNRYNGIYPYDHSRVKIPEHPEFFMNACYIDGYRKKKAYIASLGPTSKTTSDFKTFWQMVWHERSDMIVMLTKLHELSGMKCEKYWPDEGEERKYGDVTVTSKTFDVYAEYSIKTFIVSKGNGHRSLTHLHYTAWPDKTVPEDVTSLLDFRKRMKDVPITQGGPIIIHCSAGIGRTGTLIAVDILIEEGCDKGSVNVFECVTNLRAQRVKMVQTVEQYTYIHKCLVNALSFGGETIVKERIQEHLYNKNDQQYSTLFQQLKISVETDNTSEQKARLQNRSYLNKNRLEADIPGGRFNVFLNLTDGKEGSEYVNALYVNSFKRKDHFIVAQTPLPNTVTDFVSLIFQEDCSCIATMEDLNEPGMTVGAYLPANHTKVIFGNFEVSCSILEDTAACVIRKMKIKCTLTSGNGEKSIYHFQYKNWTTGSKTPGNIADFVQFVSEVEEYANELGEDRSRVVVHCLKANERSCLFCAVAIIMEKLSVEGKVNILNVIRHLRTRRSTAIVSKEQLKFCYEAAYFYVKEYTQ